MAKPTTAREMIIQLPLRHKKGVIPEWKSTVHFRIKGDGGGEFTVHIHNEQIQVLEGIHGNASLELKGDAKTYEGIELGTTSPQMAFMFGKVSVSNLSEMGNLAKVFYRVHEM
jgi:putative sterol carrier protein